MKDKLLLAQLTAGFTKHPLRLSTLGETRAFARDRSRIPG
jgi:hypothetical protein